MTSIDQERVKDELSALVDHANRRGLNSADLPVVCAICTGLLVREHGDDDDQRRQVLATLYEIMAEHAGVGQGGAH